MILKKLILINNNVQQIARVWLDKMNRSTLYIEKGTNTKVIKFQFELIAASVYSQLDKNTITRFLCDGDGYFSTGEDYTLINLNLN